MCIHFDSQWSLNGNCIGYAAWINPWCLVLFVPTPYNSTCPGDPLESAKNKNQNSCLIFKLISHKSCHYIWCICFLPPVRLNISLQSFTPTVRLKIFHLRKQTNKQTKRVKVQFTAYWKPTYPPLVFFVGFNASVMHCLILSLVCVGMYTSLRTWSVFFGIRYATNTTHDMNKGCYTTMMYSF